MIIFKKINLIINTLLNAKFIFKSPTYKDIVVFDGESSGQLKHVLKDFEYNILETRFHRIKKLFITKKIIFKIIRNYNGNLLSSYLLTIIDQIKPKIIFTYIDNSYRFSQFSKLRNKKYKFIALQNGARYEHKILNELIKKKNNKKKIRNTKISYSSLLMLW